MGASNVRKGGRPKGRYALIAIMRYGVAREISHKYTRREHAIEDAQALNRGLEPNGAVLTYCVRPRGARWGVRP